MQVMETAYLEGQGSSMAATLRERLFALAIITGTLFTLLYLRFFNPATPGTGYYPSCPFHTLTGLNCPGCGTLLLHADHGPQSPREWEQWTRVLTKALRKTSVVLGEVRGDDQTTRLMHADCRQHEQHRRQPVQRQTEPTPSGACLSRMR